MKSVCRFIRNHRFTEFVDSLTTFYSAVILIDYDNSGYGYRAWDLLYFMSNWNYDFSRDDVIAYLYAYIDAQTYSSYLTIEILLDEFKHHEPYFWLERLLFLMVKLSFHFFTL